ncbi:NADH dehydrogenase FAD-containing subunit [Leptospira fletcheri]|uniref:NADH dehydrogenase FAD-containing subunit n=1 Tax=Leptospira fletcheri TaxID=2484981 RepID=A0A4R9GI51_9LEPT|nr:FAD-dependent oxidoreductase [Leptospira fletcheri]TGK12428.1 NADH dehydrogenase FAD-containing subunit [Leptospira fletcheri]
MESKSVIIVGGGYAGIVAANRLARKKLPIRILLITGNETFIEKIRNHQEIAGTNSKFYSVRSLLRKEVELKTGFVESILKEKQRVRLTNGEEYPYDFLGYTLGMRAKTGERFPETYHSIAEEKDCKRIRQELYKNPGRRITVLGGGLTGIETASELAERFSDAKIALVDSGQIGGNFNAEAAMYMRETLLKLGVSLFENRKAISFLPDGILTDTGEKISHDICLLSAGLSASPVGTESGWKTNELGQVLVSETLQVPDKWNILGAGDGIRILGEGHSHLRMSCATALPMGVYMAERISFLLGTKSEIGSKPFSLGYVIRCVSLGRKYGLIQHLNPDDTPKHSFWKGRFGAMVKELICKFTVFSFKAEKYFDFYNWPAGPKLDRIAEPRSEKAIVAAGK